jgi:anti-anti-sigma regulatory factor
MRSRIGIVRWLRRWTIPRATDEKTALQERTVYALAIPTIVLFAAGFLIDLFLFVLSQVSPYQVLSDFVFLVCVIVAYAITRRGRVRWGVLALVFTDLAIFGFYTYLEGYRSINPLLLLVAVTVSGIGLGKGAGFSVATLSMVLYGFAVLAEHRGWFTPVVEVSPVESVTSFAVVIYLLASLIAVFTHWVYRTVQDQAWTLKQQMTTLQAADEQRTALLRTLQERIEDQERLLAELRASTQARAQLAEALRSVENPVVPVLQGVVVMPITGELDTARVKPLTDDLLAGAERHRARLAILDITGVPEISEAVADALLQTMDAASLVGVECVLVGIRPDMVQSLLNLSIDLRQVTSRRDLQSGIAYALGRTGRRIVAAP